MKFSIGFFIIFILIANVESGKIRKVLSSVSNGIKEYIHKAKETVYEFGNSVAEYITCKERKTNIVTTSITESTATRTTTSTTTSTTATSTTSTEYSTIAPEFKCVCAEDETYGILYPKIDIK